MALWFLLVLALGQAPRPSAPANIAVGDVTTATVSSGEDAYITWTVDPTTVGMSYDIGLDDGPWSPVLPADLEQIPLAPAEAAKIRMYAVKRGKLTLGPHTFRVRECDATRATCSVPVQTTVTVIPPVECQMGTWSDWTPWTVWIPEGSVDRQYHYRYRSITRAPGVGAAPCPNSVETATIERPHAIPPAPTLDPLTVSFVRMDSATQGAWRGVYGGQGQAFAGLTPAPVLPFVVVSPVRAAVWTWAASTADVRGLQRPDTTTTDRFASAWYGDVFELDVTFSDAVAHQVALYAVDWDGLGRAQTIEVLDSLGTVKHTVTTGPELRTGVYYVWRISGHARIRVTRTAGANGVAFALLFGQ